MGTIDIHDDWDWVECWNCSGEGSIEDECECTLVADQCYCETPTPRECYVCKGLGGWTDVTEPTTTQENE